MLRTTMMAMAFGMFLAMAAAGSEVKRMTPPPASMADKDMPAYYSPNGVKGLQMTSSIATTSEGETRTETTWRWKDNRNHSFTLTRRKTSYPEGGPVGDLGEFTLTRISPPTPVVPAPVPAPAPGKMKAPPAGTPDAQLPAFYSPNGVQQLRVVSNASRDDEGRVRTQTVWRWQDNRGVSFTLTRLRTATSTRYTLTRGG